jgi:hypothetical protein
MSARAVLLVAASVLIASPGLALAKHHKSTSASNDPILNHSGPISYEELLRIDSGGYNSRSGHHKHRHMHKTVPSARVTPPDSTGVDATPAPAPSPPSTPDTPATPPS